MSGLLSQILGRPKNTELAGFRVQTTVYGAPIPIVYGRMRIAGNLIHLPAEPVLVSEGSKGSKGASGGNLYEAPVVIALCEGEIDSVATVWRDKDGEANFGASYAGQGWALGLGTLTQSPWSFLTSDYPGEAVPYQSTAYVCNEAGPLPNDSMPQYSWEVLGFFMFNYGGGIFDASPAAILPDLLTSAQYGVGWDAAQIGSLTAFEDYCAAYGAFASPALDNQRPAADWINELCEVANTALVWSDGVLKLIPYGDTAATANGRTFTPNVTPLYDLDDDDYLAPPGTDPVTATRRNPSEVPNQVQVTYRDRAFSYNETTYTATDQLAAEAYGIVPLAPLSLPLIATAAVAQQVAQLRLQREQNIANTYSFRLGWRYSLLEPMDLVTLTDAGLGLSLAPVRITEIIDSGDEGGFDVVAEDWPLGSASATLYTTPSANGTATNANVDPGNTTTPIIFEGPLPLASSPLEVWIGASGGADWGGCDVYISVDDVSFERVGTIRSKSTFGALTATLATNAAYPAIDTTHVLAVDLTSSGGALVAQSQANFDELIPLCYLGGREFIAYRDAALTSAYHYDLDHLYRGLYASTVASHASTTVFVFCDGAILRVPWPLGYVGQVLYFKFPSFNIYGAALQDLASVSSVSHTVGEDPVIIGAGTPQGTISIDALGNWTATLDGPEWAQSIKYSTSTSAFPSDATVIASGTGANGRTITFSGGPLTSGQTIYISAIAYDATGGTGLAGPSGHVRATFVVSAAIPQGTVSVDDAGYWSATADGPDGTNSFRYLTSTSAFPSDGSVTGGGTLVASVRTFSLVGQGPLASGDTIYLTVIAYTSADGTTGPGQSAHLRGAYQYITPPTAFAFASFTVTVGSYATDTIDVAFTDNGQLSPYGYYELWGDDGIPGSFAFLGNSMTSPISYVSGRDLNSGGTPTDFSYYMRAVSQYGVNQEGISGVFVQSIPVL